MPENICAHCGRPESEHCIFEPVRRPDTCVCDPREWDNPANIPDVCAEFVGEIGGRCESCEHDRECHEKKD